MGETVTLAATPSEGYAFDSAYCSNYLAGNYKADIVDGKFVMPDHDVDIYASFKRVETQKPNNNQQNQNPAPKEFISLYGKPTIWPKTPLNWFLCVCLFGWIWMAFKPA